jgi:hypothetical protein
MIVIHYHEDTGRIAVWGSANAEQSFLPDHRIVRLDLNGDYPVNPKLHKIVDDRLVEIPAMELRKWNMPLAGEVAALIEHTLSATDQYMMPDRNVPNINEWRTYRQTLRDLSKLATIDQMLDAWPRDPNGVDAIANLRNRT